ncbi:UNVERIFIED_CONTAM: hypothetical protein Slati_3546600 [Sesamum latifolium]|uniref:G-patch domain-containing protein n=1 Tax=Sesamum latifolium TaxID=2727402 RepID=A0AAW2UJE9_9LAMI
MAGNNEPEESECGFQWDENSQLYYHASSGFYHDPQAGWYYSSKDGLYYKFEDGKYVLLESNLAEEQPEMHNTNCQGETSEAEMEGKEVAVEPSLGYSNQTTYAAASDMSTPMDTNDTEKLNPPAHGWDDDIEELEEGEWIPDDPDFWRNLDEKILDEGISQEEENWRAQYGQVSQLDEEWMSDLQAVDLWDWALVRGTKKDGKTEVARLVGRLRKRSSKLHPSVPSGGGILKTAPVCEVHLDIVRVTSGRIYRLRIPSLQYLASLSVYDASNPTKDWGFPQLSIKNQTEKLRKDDQQSESQGLESLGVRKDKNMSSIKLSSSKKDHVYRDRAAERRALHGGFGIGPGQKNSLTATGSTPSSPTLQPEEAAAESLNMSFGAGSYARKILEGMGWKEGETLGCSMKGLTEPLQATGNKGTAGLGWNDGRRK